MNGCSFLEVESTKYRVESTWYKEPKNRYLGTSNNIKSSFSEERMMAYEDLEVQANKSFAKTFIKQYQETIRRVLYKPSLSINLHTTQDCG